MLSTWFGNGSKYNFWVMTGRISGVVVVDCDNAKGLDWWLEKIPNLRDTATVKTSKGYHFWFKIPDDWNPDRTIQSWSSHAPKSHPDPASVPSFDVRADINGVIVPPSVHETGHIYTWTTPLSDALVAPPELLDGTWRKQAPSTADASGVATREDRAGNTRSMLSALLSKPPAKGGRNDWMARVAGHYAKTYHNQYDLYRTHVEAANALCSPPLKEKEFEKTVESIWQGEHERNPQRAMDANCGWLQSAGTVIMTQVVRKVGEDKSELDVEEYADFDMVAKGVMVNEDSSRVYWVQIVRKNRRGSGNEIIDAVLPGHVLGDDRAIRKWLAKFACTVNPPENMYPKGGSMGVRLQRYIESQQPSIVVVTSVLGWDRELFDGEGGFVTHDGVITKDKILSSEEAGVRPNPTLLAGGMAPHQYGFEGSPQEARRVLREVMSFHFPQVVAPFGAWFGACLLKPQLEARTSLFPFMAIEAPSESGKTNGFFDLMTQLNGNTRGETQPTRAALRDMAASHRNGIVWVDDLDDPAYLMELLRAATSGGSLTKMGEDRESVKNTQIVAPIVISGEALGLGTQKALLDRAVIVKVASPVGRKSVHDPNRPQWEDVLSLREQYPGGLSAVAGWLVQEALTVQYQVFDALKEGREGHAGRVADKFGILRAGARLMDYLMAEDEDEQADAWAGEGSTATDLEAWIHMGESAGIEANENTLSLQVLPWALRTFKIGRAHV